MAVPETWRTRTRVSISIRWCAAATAIGAAGLACAILAAPAQGDGLAGETWYSHAEMLEILEASPSRQKTGGAVKD